MIDLFPERMLDSSIHTSILVGLLVLWGATETFGWVFAGFVVPGYLAAIASVAPLTAAAIAVEAVLTYGLAWALIAGAAEVGLWGRAFGRERFLAFVLLSVPVRLFVELFAARGLEELLAPLFGLEPGYSGRFFGLGVVLVPLLANAFWKTGLARGVLQVGAYTAATAAVLHLVLEPLTNFHFGAFEFLFEDLAQDFLAVPKVYVVLLITVFLAARNNLDFGWDFGGILVPAFFAILVFTPLKIASTLGEVVLLVLAFTALRRVPAIRARNLDGPRLLVAVYSLGYALKWLAAWVATWLHVAFRISDVYGFGYLLTALIAVRCIRADSIPKILVPVVFTAAQGIALGLGVSVLLTALLPATVATSAAPDAPLPVADLEDAVLLSAADVRGPSSKSGPGTAGPAFVKQLERLSEPLSAPDRATLEAAAAPLRAAGFEVALVGTDDRRTCLAFRLPRSGPQPPPSVPSVLWCGGPGPVLYVPRARSDPGSLAAAAALARRGQLAGVLVEPVDTGLTPAPPSLGESRRDVAAWRRVRGLLGDRPVAVLRSTDGVGALEPAGSQAVSAIRPRLGPLSDLPVSFSSAEAALGRLWPELRDEDALLTLGPHELARLLDDTQAPPLDRGPRFAGQGSIARRLAAAQLVLGTAVDEALGPARPALAEPGAAGTTVAPIAPSATLAWFCRRFGVALRVDDDGAWLLEAGSGAPPGWGSWRLQPGGQLLVIAAPRDEAEPGTGPLAMEIARAEGALIAWRSRAGGRLGEVEPDRALDDRLALPQLLLREALRPRRGLVPRLVVVRRRVPVQGRSGRLLVAGSRQPLGPGAEDPQLAALLSPWPARGVVGSGDESAGLHIASTFAVRYAESLRPGSAAVLWLSPSLLAEPRGSPDRANLLTGYRSLGLAPEPIDLRQAMLARVDPERPASETAAVAALRSFGETGSLAALRDGLSYPEARVRLLDDGRRLVLLVEQDRAVCTVVAGSPPEDRFPFSGCWSRR